MSFRSSNPSTYVVQSTHFGDFNRMAKLKGTKLNPIKIDFY